MVARRGDSIKIYKKMKLVKSIIVILYLNKFLFYLNDACKKSQPKSIGIL
ncbi:hypothetical protein CNEO3_490024 [Clostridium neonatale]|nr:hypothetical protein CNEO3_460023 [Clostridium neonatale]CAI3670489.1 hypothetical protein CNEO3_490024 [Clostridium neonatale]CAI3678372.1 hypothetical protein CNEO3_460025 [Clostridium neonatale]